MTTQTHARTQFEPHAARHANNGYNAPMPLAVRQNAIRVDNILSAKSEFDHWREIEGGGMTHAENLMAWRGFLRRWNAALLCFSVEGEP